MSLGWIMSGRPGMGEILIIVLLLVIFFGAKRLPELARALGKSMNEFKKGKAEGASDEEEQAPEKRKNDNESG